MKNLQRKIKTWSFVAILVMLVGGILYVLANRYLIQHVEIADVDAYESAVISSITTTPVAEESSTRLISSVDDEETEDGSEPVVSTSEDHWSYESDAVSIEIDKVSTGSGSNTLTYYVADVTIADATTLSNAFADNKFGENIIEHTSEIAQENDAIFAVNGDYYGFRTDGIIIRNGVIYRDVPARLGLAFYRDGTMQVYDETQTSAQELLDQGVWNTLSFGPVLIDDSVMVTDYGTVSIDSNLGNHTIQGNNPRTGVGIIDANHYVFVVVDGRSKGYSRGASLTEFAQIFYDLGCTEAYNLDGGGSSTMVFMDDVVNNPLGKEKERGISDILYIGAEG